ncbi:hypothetical protein GCM10028857_20880 [Salinarchaeum chitinilyticum]
MSDLLDSVASGARSLLGRGSRHRDRLADVETTIVVSGVRGKSSATRYLYEAFERRGYDVLAKITGNRPVCLRDGERHPIDREGSVTLYENERELREHGTPEVLILENQAISDYTNWVFNRYFADPDVVLFTNVRQDHRDTLGRDRTAIAQALARSVPEGTRVVSGEQDERIRSVLSGELNRRNCPLTHVSLPEGRESIPGAEVVYAVDAVVHRLEGEPIGGRVLEGYLEEMDVEWTRLPQGRVFNAASVNDVESTEAIRRSLARQNAPVIQPLVYLRRDRRARSDAFVSYLDSLAESGVVEQARVVGENTDPFARKADFPVVEHGPEADADRVLEDALADDWPVVLMGNTVAGFMRDLETAIDERAAQLERIEEGPNAGERDRIGDDRTGPEPIDIDQIDTASDGAGDARERNRRHEGGQPDDEQSSDERPGGERGIAERPKPAGPTFGGNES